MKFDRFVARRYLRAKRKQTFIGVISLITLFGITLGVAALNIALAIHNGTRAAFVRNLVGDTGELHIVASKFKGSGFSNDDIQQIGTMLGDVPGIEGISMMRQEHGVLFSERRGMEFTRAMGIVPADHLRASSVLRRLVQGDAGDLERNPDRRWPGIILGGDLANALGVKLGDALRLGIPRLSSPGLSMSNPKLRQLRCEVVGIFQSGHSQFDSLDSYLLLDDLLHFLNTSKVQSMLVGFKTLEDMDRAKPVLITHSKLPDLTMVSDLRDLNRNLLQALKLEKMATTLVISLFILIVALNMVSALIMLVMEKHRDIGIMKAFGTPRHVILKVFIRQGMTLSLWGTVFGSVLGVGLAVLAEKTKLIKLDASVYEVLNYVPFQVKLDEVLLVALGSLVLSFLSALYPARQAAALDPVEALKFD